MRREYTETQRDLVRAAREELFSKDYDVLAGITLVSVAKRAGVSERTAKRAFKANELREELMRDLLSIAPDRDIVHEDIAAIAGHLIDNEVPLRESVAEVAQQVFERSLTSPTLRAEAAFFALGGCYPESGDRLSLMHDEWIRGGRDAINLYAAQSKEAPRFRKDWISSEDVARVVIALTDGLALQEKGRRQNAAGETMSPKDIPPMHPDLVRRVLVAVVESMLDDGSSNRDT